MKTFERAQFVEHQNVRRLEAAKALESSMEKVCHYKSHLDNVFNALGSLHTFVTRFWLVYPASCSLASTTYPNVSVATPRDGTALSEPKLTYFEVSP